MTRLVCHKLSSDLASFLIWKFGEFLCQVVDCIDVGLSVGFYDDNTWADWDLGNENVGHGRGLDKRSPRSSTKLVTGKCT